MNGFIFYFISCRIESGNLHFQEPAFQTAHDWHVIFQLYRIFLKIAFIDLKLTHLCVFFNTKSKFLQFF